MAILATAPNSKTPGPERPHAGVSTGNAVLDHSLGGGFSPGSSVLIESEEGAGGAEFALALAEAAANRSRRARYASALRSPSRIMSEARDLFERSVPPAGLSAIALSHEHASEDVVQHLGDLDTGDVLVIETADALARLDPGRNVAALFTRLGDLAEETGALVALLHASGTLPVQDELALASCADVVISFRWRDSGPTRRRVLTVAKMRGLAPMLENENVPVLEVALARGPGYLLNNVKNVI